VDGRRLSIQGPHVDLPPKPALALAMALHELCTNALKYGALSNDKGKIEVEWSRDSAQLLRFKWRESGGPKVTPPVRRGFGSRLIEQSLARDLEGKVVLNFNPDGVVCAIEAVLPTFEGYARDHPQQ
jgi:two-component sensor histidine kinase